MTAGPPREVAGAVASADRAPVRLVINADDFGYFDHVSRGILDAIDVGIVTATGIMANGPALERWADRLRSVSGVSVGVHLNATIGVPLTSAMRSALVAAFGPSVTTFRSWPSLLAAVFRRRMSRAVLLGEWRAQIERCLRLGFAPDFLNAHEHVHMFPGLYGDVRRLAREYRIQHVRAPRGEWPSGQGAALVRAVVLSAIDLVTPGSAEPELIGLATSGRLDLPYCRRRFARLQPRGVYELMCHPGWSDPAAASDRRLSAYHDWELELRTLTSPEFRDLLNRHGIVLVSYRDLAAGRSVA